MKVGLKDSGVPVHKGTRMQKGSRSSRALSLYLPTPDFLCPQALQLFPQLPQATVPQYRRQQQHYEVLYRGLFWAFILVFAAIK